MKSYLIKELPTGRFATKGHGIIEMPYTIINAIRIGHPLQKRHRATHGRGHMHPTHKAKPDGEENYVCWLELPIVILLFAFQDFIGRLAQTRVLAKTTRHDGGPLCADVHIVPKHATVQNRRSGRRLHKCGHGANTCHGSSMMLKIHKYLIQNLPGMLQSIQGMVADCTRSSAQKYCSGSECLVMTGTCTNTMRCYAERRHNEITLTCLWTVTLHIRYMNHVHVTGNGFSLCLSSLRSSCLRFCCLRCNKTRQYGTSIILKL